MELDYIVLRGLDLSKGMRSFGKGIDGIQLEEHTLNEVEQTR